MLRHDADAEHQRKDAVARRRGGASSIAHDDRGDENGACVAIEEEGAFVRGQDGVSGVAMFGVFDKDLGKRQLKQPVTGRQ